MPTSFRRVATTSSAPSRRASSSARSWPDWHSSCASGQSFSVGVSLIRRHPNAAAPDRIRRAPRAPPRRASEKAADSPCANSRQGNRRDVWRCALRSLTSKTKASHPERHAYGMQQGELLGGHWERCDTELAWPPSARRSRRRVCLRRARRQSLRRTSRRRTGARPLAAKRSSKPRRRARNHRPASRRFWQRVPRTPIPPSTYLPESAAADIIIARTLPQIHGTWEKAADTPSPAAV